MFIILVTEYLDNSAYNYPQKLAFASNDCTMTFAQLRAAARCVAMSLIQKKIFRHPVAVFMEKSPKCIAAFLGTAYSGNFYTPLDTAMPTARIKKIVELLNPSAIITDATHAETARSFAEKAPVILYEEAQKIVPDEKAIDFVVEEITETDVLYVMFTSGSTGVPKGVVISHRGVTSYMEWAKKAFGLNEKVILGNQTPFYFSMSVFDIYVTLSCGGTAYIIPKKLFSFPKYLLEFIRDNKINLIYWVPSALCLVVNLKAIGHCNISCLDKVLFAGEVMPARHLNIWRANIPKAMFANLFGPTEATDICNYYIINRQMTDNETIPIGTIVPNMKMIILDENDRPAQEGELCIGGSSLAYGYYNDPERTRAAFVQNPLNGYYPEYIYRTGDIVRYNSLGELVFVSRKDFQIKHMGHRIEMGEIEAAATSLNGVAQSCCIYDAEKRKIVLFYSGLPSTEEIIDLLKTLLPNYMLPSKAVQLKGMPLNQNGKIDRKAIKEQYERGNY